MISISRGARFRSGSLPVFSLLAGLFALLIAGCGGGGGNGGGGGGGTQTYTISVASTNPANGVTITYGGTNTTSVTTGTTPFSFTAAQGGSWTFSASATAGGNNFSSWSGCTSSTAGMCTVAVSGNATITANYVTPVAPTVTVTPGAGTITTGQTLSVTVGVAGATGSTTPSGSVVLTSGSYTSAATALASGSATISIPAGSLATGTDTLKATYTPDTAGAVNYLTASGTASVTVTLPPAPTISVSLSNATIAVNQALTATVTVAGSTGSATPTGSVAVTGGGLTSTVSGTLSNGSVTLSIPASSLSVGSERLTFTYTPDSGSSATYSSATKTATVTVNGVYTLTVNTTSPASGVDITASTDLNGKSGGDSPLTLSYAGGTNVVLTAPATSGSNTFSAWSGCNSTQGSPALTCNVTVNANTTVTAAYGSGPLVTVSPGSASVTIGQSQQFAATVTGVTNTTVTWTVAVASGSGSAGTISTSGLYQSPYPAPATVTVTATSTSDPSVSGTATVTLVAPATAAGPAITIDANVNDGNPSNPNCASGSPCPISPLIYGMNAYLLDQTTAADTNTTVARWGGDATSRYNYQNGDSNSASDYYFSNGSPYGMLTTNSNSVNSPANFNDFIAETTALGIKSIGTAPVLGYVANNTTSACSFPKSSYPNQTAYDSANCGNGIIAQGQPIPNTSPAQTCNTAGGCSFSGSSTTWQTTSFQETGLPPTAPTAPVPNGWAQGTWAGGWVNCLLTKGSDCTNAAGNDATIWDLDNEPAWWDGVHRDVHPAPSTYDEVTNGEIATALAIKEADPKALVSGPIIDYWWNYFYSKKDIENGWATGPCYQPWSGPVDREAHGGVPMIEYYLQQMSEQSANYGLRLLDYVDIHGYVAATYNGSSVGLTTAGDTGEQQARVNSTRALWDSTYTDPNFPQPNYSANPSQQSCTVPLQSPELIPMLEGWVKADYPGTKTSIDEYNFGGTEAINGAVTQADVLGIFGKYGLDMGVFWPTGDYTSNVPGNMAFEIYRNYDGNKSTFGDEALTASSTNQGTLSVYAASRSTDNAVTIVVINKTYGSLTDTLSINNLTSTATSAQVFQYSNANLNAIVAQPAATVTAPVSPSTASTIGAASSQPLTFPAQSITLIVIPAS